MKSSKKILFALSTFFVLLPQVFATSYYGVANTVAKIRPNPSTNNNKIALTSTGNMYDLVSKDLIPDQSTNPDNNCPNGWYQIHYNNSTAYVCSDYLDVFENVESTSDSSTPSNDCEVQMQQAGFPGSYWSKLCALKNNHPNWNFHAITKDSDGKPVDWVQSLIQESKCGKNTITTNGNGKYINSSCDTPTDSGYSHANMEAVKYYMDPRNFLNETNIFMFEGTNRNDTISREEYKTAIQKIFNNNFLVQQIGELPEYILNAASSGVNSTAIATRIKQELGNAQLSDGTLYSVVSGRYSTRYNWTYNGVSVDNYYNFYNIGAYDGSGVTQKALIYALQHGWGGTGNQSVDRQTAVTGGANFLYDRYVNAGQNTIYFQKFNIFPTVTTSRYLNQYMTNIQAPVSESKIVYNAYKNANLLNSSFNFYIPVFSNMDNTVSENNSDNSDSSIQSEQKKLDVNTIVNGAGFRYDNGYITNIKPGMTASELKGSLESIGGANTVTITDENGNMATNTVGTGYKVIVNGATMENLTIIIYGDASGDGKINALDLLKVQKNILGTVTLSGAYKKAADASKDNNINALDLLKVQKNILGSGTIEQ